MTRMVPPDRKLTGRNASKVRSYKKDREGAGSPPVELGYGPFIGPYPECFVCCYLRRRMA
jgi:hypothetical protein